MSVNSVPLLDVNRGNRPLKEEALSTIADILDSGRFIGGPHCQNLEESVGEICETEFAIGCASGSDALLLALMACNIGPGDEVICPSFTFFATASAIERLGAVPVFVDIEPDSFNLDATSVAAAITKRTRAIIPVHLFGQCCEMDSILDLANDLDINVIEDAAQSIGATYRGKPAGSIGDIGCFSFYPTKNLGGCGDGGMLTTNDPELADRLRLLANHGMRPRYYHKQIGINSRLDSIQAAILNIKIRDVHKLNQDRARNSILYQRHFTRLGLVNDIGLPVCVHEDSRHVWNQYTIRVPGNRDDIRQQLVDANVGTEIYYPIPLHRQECFQHLGYEVGTLTETEKAASEVLSLPIFPELTEDEIGYVCDCVANALASQQAELRMAS